MKESCKTAEKKSSQKKLIRSMLCCFGRPRRKFVASNLNLQEENWVPTVPVGNDDDNDSALATKEVLDDSTGNGNENNAEVPVILILNKFWSEEYSQ